MKEPLNTGLTGVTNSSSGVNVTRTIAQTTGSNVMLDRLFPFLLIGLFAFVLIMAGTIIKHPIMIFVGIIVLGIVILLAVIYSNLYNNISETAEFSSQKTTLSLTDKFMHYLPIVVFVMAIGIVSAILYSRGGGTTTI
jgi:small-conductance mechanosensitive channel